MTLIFLAIFECSGWGCLSGLKAEMDNFLNVVTLTQREVYSKDGGILFICKLEVDG